MAHIHPYITDPVLNLSQATTSLSQIKSLKKKIVMMCLSFANQVGRNMEIDCQPVGSSPVGVNIHGREVEKLSQERTPEGPRAPQ